MAEFITGIVTIGMRQKIKSFSVSIANDSNFGVFSVLNDVNKVLHNSCLVVLNGAVEKVHPVLCRLPAFILFNHHSI